MLSYGPLHMDEHRLESIYNSLVPIQKVTWKTSRDQRAVETGGERMSGKSVLAAWPENTHDIYYEWTIYYHQNWGLATEDPVTMDKTRLQDGESSPSQDHIVSRALHWPSRQKGIKEVIQRLLEKFPFVLVTSTITDASP